MVSSSRQGRGARAAAVTALACVAPLLGALSTGCGAPPGPSSVLLVVVDTWRADHLGVYGYERATSPGLARWVERAAVFERAFATSPWTLPSMGSLFTGHIPSRHAAGLALPPEPDGKPRFAHLDASVRPLGVLFRERGFATAAVANNPFLHPGFGLARGFDTWDYVFGSYAKHPRASQIVYWAFRWLDAREDRPFLLVLHAFDPHLSYDPPPGVRGRFTGEPTGSLKLPFTGFGDANARWVPSDPADRRFVTAAYDEELLFVDGELARLLGGLEERALLDETLVVVTSDHGEELFDHGGFEHGHTMYQELLRVPLLVWGPGVRPGVREVPVSLADLLPTLLEAVGLPPEPGLAGRSLWPLLTRGRAPDESALVVEGTLHGPDRKALVRWPWKLVVTAGEPHRLHHLARDPSETLDLAEQEPGRVASLLEELHDRTSEAAAARTREVPARLDAEIEEQLRALGYLDRAVGSAP